MDCKNLNLEELLKKSKEFDKISKELEHCKKTYTENFNELKLFLEKNNLKFVYKEDFVDTVISTIRHLLDSNHQGVLLAQERKRYNQEFKEVMQNFERSMEEREKELIEAWEKFRVISTKKYKKTLEEINNEDI
jgi:hypothetical protein